MRRLRNFPATFAALLVIALAPLLLPPAPAMAGGSAPTWVPALPVQQQGETFLSLFSEGTGYAMHTNGGNNGFLYATQDFGVTWEPRFLPPFGATGIVRFGSPRVGYGVGNGRFFRSIDGGMSWDELPGPPPVGYTFLDALDSTERGHFAVAGGTPERGGFCRNPNKQPLSIFLSRDRGETWAETRLSFPGIVQEVDFLDRTFGVVLATVLEWEGSRGPEPGECSYGGVGVEERVLYTSDGGRTFEEVLASEVPVTAVGIADPGRFVVGWSDGRVALTTDGGRTFRESRLPSVVEPGDLTIYWVSALRFADEKVGYAGTNGRGTWRTDDGGETWSEETSPQVFFGIGIGDLAVADREHALAGGPTFIIRRVPST